MEDNQPITRRDLEEALDRAVQAIATAVQAEITAAKAELNARIEHVETSLLTEFQKWASPVEARQRTHAAAIRALDVEIEYHEDRLKKLEGKQPPQ
jgi:hypothetical protein